MTDERSVVLAGEVLDGMELILSGALSPIDGYCLPGGKPEAWPFESSLRVQTSTGLAPGMRLNLCDPDNTPIASLVVDAVRPADDDRTWLAGKLTGLRRAEHGPARASRVTGSDDFTDHVVALFSASFRPADVLTAVHHASGRPLVLVAVGRSDDTSTVRLIHELDDCATQLDDAVTRFVPVVDLATPSDVAAAVVRERRAEELLDFRRAGESDRGGAVVLFTGLSGAGKSTVARALVETLAASGEARPVLLDGDHVRRELASELTFSREDREKNLERIAWVAARVAEAGGLAVCAPIAPFTSSRAAMRAKVEPHSPFIVVYVSTPLAVAEERDRKGLYAKARAGLIKDFTGIDSPYEVPDDADLSIDTSTLSVEQCVHAVALLLERKGLISGE